MLKFREDVIQPYFGEDVSVELNVTKVRTRDNSHAVVLRSAMCVNKDDEKKYVSEARKTGPEMLDYFATMRGQTTQQRDVAEKLAELSDDREKSLAFLLHTYVEQLKRTGCIKKGTGYEAYWELEKMFKEELGNDVEKFRKNAVELLPDTCKVVRDANIKLKTVDDIMEQATEAIKQFLAETILLEIESLPTRSSVSAVEGELTDSEKEKGGVTKA